MQAAVVVREGLRGSSRVQCTCVLFSSKPPRVAAACTMRPPAPSTLSRSHLPPQVPFSLADVRASHEGGQGPGARQGCSSPTSLSSPCARGDRTYACLPSLLAPQSHHEQEYKKSKRAGATPASALAVPLPLPTFEWPLLQVGAGKRVRNQHTGWGTGRCPPHDAPEAICEG